MTVVTPSLYGFIWMFYCLCRQMVKDICTFKKVFLEEKELDKSAEDNWRYEENYFGTAQLFHFQFCIEYFVRTGNKAFLLICF